MKAKKYLLAEKFFLASLFENIKHFDYASFSGSLDNLSLYLYSQGNCESKDRALEFYKLFSKFDRNVSCGYAMAIINGVFGDVDYDETMRQLSKAWYSDKLFIVADLLYEGKILKKKDDYKAALFVKSRSLKLSHIKQ